MKLTEIQSRLSPEGFIFYTGGESGYFPSVEGLFPLIQDADGLHSHPDDERTAWGRVLTFDSSRMRCVIQKPTQLVTNKSTMQLFRSRHHKKPRTPVSYHVFTGKSHRIDPPAAANMIPNPW